MSLYEHQSTYNPNLPLRFLLYIAELYEKIIQGKNLYGTKRIPIPTPNFIVFYNGKEERPERETLKLSDSYIIKGERVSLELVAEVLNINVGHNQELLEACKTLGDYAEYVRRVREYVKDMPIEQAVDKTISECVQEGILQEFLKNNRAEARAMSIYEYDQEEHIRLEREDAYEDGRKDGVVEGRAEGRIEGRNEGRAEGERKKLIELVEKKLAKKQTIEQIAEALEESTDVIREIVESLR